MKKLLLTLGTVAAVAAPVASVVACSSDKSAFEKSEVGKQVGSAQLDIRNQAATDKTGHLHKAENSEALKAELATLIDAAKNGKDDETKGPSYHAEYTFLKRTKETPLLDALIADDSNGQKDTAYTFDLAFAASGEVATNVARADVDYILIALKDGDKIDASTFSDEINGKDAEISFLLARVEKDPLKHSTPIAFVTPKEAKTLPPTQQPLS